MQAHSEPPPVRELAAGVRDGLPVRCWCRIWISSIPLGFTSGLLLASPSLGLLFFKPCQTKAQANLSGELRQELRQEFEARVPGSRPPLRGGNGQAVRLLHKEEMRLARAEWDAQVVWMDGCMAPCLRQAQQHRTTQLTQELGIAVPCGYM